MLAAKVRGAGLSESSGFSDFDPISSLVAGASKSTSVDKRF